MTPARRPVLMVLRWALAIAACAFVAWAVPVRDRCWDPRVPESTKAAVSRVDGGACVLHLRSGDVRVEATECARLECEPGVASTFVRVNLPALAGLLALYGIGTLAWAARWRALLGFAGIDLPLGRVWRVSIEAQAGGVVLPGGLGGDALRIASVASRPSREGQKRAPTAIVVASVLLDRAVGLAVLASVAATLGFALGGLGAGAMAYALAAIPVAIAAGVVVVRRAPERIVARLSRGRLGPVLEYVRDSRAPRAIALAALLSVAVAIVQFATVRGFVFALGATPAAQGEKWVYVGAAMAFIVAAVPALPGAWGTADAAYVFFLGRLAGLGAGVALAVCLLYRLFWYLSAVVGAVLVVARPRQPPSPS